MCANDNFYVGIYECFIINLINMDADGASVKFYSIMKCFTGLWCSDFVILIVSLYKRMSISCGVMNEEQESLYYREMLKRVFFKVKFF